MIHFVIKLFSFEKRKKLLRGNAYFKKNGENIWSKIAVFKLKPNDNYIIFYIIQNPAGKQSALEMSSAKVNNQGKLIAERHLKCKILDGHCYKDKTIIAVILVEKNDRDIEFPIMGLRKANITWKPLIEKYIKSLECNHNTSFEEYSHNETYDNIINNLPESNVFEKREKIDKAVEINSLNELNLGNIPANITFTSHKKPLLIRMKAGNAILYLLGLPEKYSTDKKVDFLKNNYRTFLCNSSKETLNDNSEGYWCRYI